MDTDSQEFASNGKALTTSDPNVEVLPRFRGRRPSLRSLTGTARESASLYVQWRRGFIDRGTYLAGARGLAIHKDILSAVEQERVREFAENMQQQLDQHLNRPPQQFDYGSSDAAAEPVAAEVES